MGSFKKIQENIAILLRNSTLDSVFLEFAGHFLDQYQLTVFEKNKMASISTTQSSEKSETFVIEQWDKTRADTLFLGNEVECCLAAGSAQFSAILQRIMDDAMLFHVVTEQSTQKPVALSWLYLAETEDKKIYIVANFLEIKAKYGADEPTRKAIMDELLRFTGEQYCAANPGLAGFLIGPLLYGWNRNKLGDLPTQSLSLTDKVGGALSPAQEETDSQSAIETNSSETQKIYYLNSLSCTQFYFYPSPEKKMSNAAGLFGGTTAAPAKPDEPDEPEHKMPRSF